MSARIRRVDVILALVVVVSLVAVGSTMLAGLGPAEQQARCAANLRLFGEALAGYVEAYGTFPPDRAYPPLYPATEDNSGLRLDPPHGYLLNQMGYLPGVDLTPYGWDVYDPHLPIWHRLRSGPQQPSVAVCPAADTDVLWTVNDQTQYGGVQSYSVLWTHTACYAYNEILRSPTGNGRNPSTPNLDNPRPVDNMFQRSVGLWFDLGEGEENYYVQMINTDEVRSPVRCAAMWDGPERRWGGYSGSLLAGEFTAPLPMLGNRVLIGPPRHEERANILYVDGHVADDHQVLIADRPDLGPPILVFEDVPPGGGYGPDRGRYWYIANYPLGDDEPPTVATTWPADGGSVSAAAATQITIQFSEQVYVNSSNVTINGGAVTPDSTQFETNDSSFTLVFDSPLPAGSYLVIVNAAVTDRVGNQLDGDGDGTAGDPFWFDFTVYDNLVVDPNGGPYQTIQAAIDAAVEGDVIVVSPSVYGEKLDFLGKGVMVRGVDASDPNTVAATVIDASNLLPGPVVTFATGEGAGAVLDGLTVTGGHGGFEGGGVYIEDASPTIRRCRLVGNEADLGGGVYCWGGAPTIEASVIRGNQAADGAGVYCFDSGAVIRSSALAENQADYDGAAIYCGGFGDELILNNTIVGNTADGGGMGGAAVFCILSSRATVAGNILWQNADSDIAVVEASPTVAFNLFAAVPVGYELFDNIAGDPGLADWPNGDYHIGYDSPCVNAGDVWFMPSEQVIDLDGDPRVGLGRVDIGADEIAEPEVIYVATCGDDAWSGADPNCLGPDGPKRTIQAAIDAARDHHEVVVVLSGTYQENIDFVGKAITVTGTEPDDPNVVAATTVEGGSGPVASFVSDEGPDSVLTGLTITHAGGASGVGVQCNAGPTIRKNVVTGHDEGGIRGGAPAILENVISFNGGNVSQGGGVYVSGLGARVIGNRIAQNQAIDEGGGIYGDGTSQFQVVGNVIEGNTAGQLGGGMCLSSRDRHPQAAISDNLFVRNTAAVIAALYCPYGYSPRDLVVQHNTFAFNTGQHALATAGDPEDRRDQAVGLANCILYNPDTDAEAGHIATSRYPTRYCLIRGWAGGDELGNFDADPQFVDPNSGDYHLLPSSPCVNAGDPNYFVGPDAVDLDGNPRLQRGRVDVGCYETPFVSLLVSEPPADGTLPRTADNVIELVFNGTISPLPPGLPVSIAPLAGGDDVTGSFSVELVTTTVTDDTLRAVENGSALPNQTWYRIEPVAGLEVVPFVLDVCTLIGDADGSGHVTTGDYGEVKLHLGERGDVRWDMDASGRVTTADYGVVKTHMGEQAPAKPGP